MRSVLVAALLLLASPSAYAFERQHQLGASADIALLSVEGRDGFKVAFGGSARYSYGITDAWNFVAKAGAFGFVGTEVAKDGTTLPKTIPSSMFFGSVGAVYTFDVIQFVPYAGVMIGPSVFAGGTLEGARWALSGDLLAGVTWNLSRNFAVGATVEQRFMLTDFSTYPSLTCFGLNASYVWGW